MSDIEERFWAKVNKLGPDDCWEWQACVNRDGYGIFTVSGHNVLSHRFVMGLMTGDPGVVRHTCDHPPCCNPSHLIVGTKEENEQDKVVRGRSSRGEDRHSCKLTEQEVLEIYKSNNKQVDLAKEYGVTNRQISKIKKGQRWGWLTNGD